MIFARLIRRALAAKLPPHVLVKMPALSPTMTSGNIGAWRKKEGDEVAVGDVLVEIETDKAQMEFESTEDGYLAKILQREGQKDVEVMKPLAVIVSDKKIISQFKDFDGEAGEAEAKAAMTIKREHTSGGKEEYTCKTEGTRVDGAKEERAERVKASPLAKAMAREHSIDLSAMRGTGTGGRIVKDDVAKARTGPGTGSDHGQQKQAVLSEDDKRMRFVDVQLTGMRKTIAERLAFSTRTIPHYYLTLDDLSMTMVLRARGQLNAQIASQNIKLSVNDFVIKAAAMALKAVPQVNSSWRDGFIRQFETVDVCFAVATDAGLITPIVHDADRVGLLETAATTRSLAERAKAGKLKPAEFQGGTFTVSNLGMLGISSFTAIINPPQSAILAVGRTGPAETLSVTLSCDHRVIDGAVGARWLQAFRGYLEEPFQLLL